MSVFIVLGALALLAGVTMVVTAIRGPVGERPTSAVLLIAGAMVAALGLLLAGFAIAYRTAAPLDLNAGATR
jgi:hypothetical protein